jgi:hypothetical protein
MHNATFASGIAASSPKAGQSASSTASLPPPLNVSNFLNTSDPHTFPRAFTNGTICGDYAALHTSDLKYGADVGLIQIGDLDRLWRETVGDPSSRFQVLSYDAGGIGPIGLTNHFLASGRDNPFFAFAAVVGWEDKYGGDAW